MDCDKGHGAIEGDNLAHNRHGTPKCRACMRGSRLATRACRGCQTEYKSSNPSPYCDACRAERSAAPAPAARAEQRRVCIDCEEEQSLEEFRLRLSPAEYQAPGVRRYDDVCLGCREEGSGSPFEQAKQEIREMFPAVPVEEWMNHDLHPLNVLHYALTLTHARASDPAIFASFNQHSFWTEESAWKLVTRAGLTPRPLQQNAA